MQSRQPSCGAQWLQQTGFMSVLQALLNSLPALPLHLSCNHCCYAALQSDEVKGRDASCSPQSDTVRWWLALLYVWNSLSSLGNANEAEDVQYCVNMLTSIQEPATPPTSLALSSLLLCIATKQSAAAETFWQAALHLIADCCTDGYNVSQYSSLQSDAG